VSQQDGFPGVIAKRGASIPANPRPRCGASDRFVVPKVRDGARVRSAKTAFDMFDSLQLYLQSLLKFVKGTLECDYVHNVISALILCCGTLLDGLRCQSRQPHVLVALFSNVTNPCGPAIVCASMSPILPLLTSIYSVRGTRLFIELQTLGNRKSWSIHALSGPSDK
jgi:hypothetical protein